jgi:tyrosine-specific transport protein
MEQKSITLFQKISAVCLLAGTCIGGGMLALPLALSTLGLIPSIVVMLGSCFFMILTGLLILEVNLWLGEDVHIITMASKTLGKWGKGVSWIVYLFVCYASLVAYIAGGGELVSSFLSSAGIEFGNINSGIAFTFLLGSLLLFGTRFVSRVNTLLFTGMIVAYFSLLGIGMKEISGTLLAYSNFNCVAALMAIPMLLTSFSYQWVIPSVTPLLKGNEKAMRWSIIIGISLAAVLYILWLVIVFGIVPIEGDKGLIWASDQGIEISASLRYYVKSNWVAKVSTFFAFFAIATSFLGMTLGLFDFLADGLKVDKRGKSKYLLLILILVPSCYFALTIPGIFDLALEVTGGYGDAILNGMIPAMMVWVGRYHQKRVSQYSLPGGKGFLAVIFVISFCIVVLQTFKFFI